MQNPFLKDRKYTIAYGAAWILIASIHAVVLWVFQLKSPGPAILDALIFNLLFAGLGFSSWFAVRYSDNRVNSVVDRVLNHLLTAVVFVAFWLAIGYFIAYYTLSGFEGYRDFLQLSILWRAISGLFFYSLVILIYFLHINSEDRQTRIQREARLNLQVREAEIDMLKAQINPHFLFNSLNSITSLIGSHPEKASDMVVKLSDFLRYSLEKRENELTTLEKEIQHIGRYLEIEKVRFGDRLHFRIEIPERCWPLKLPHMILQPLIENSIKHGVYESTEPVEILLVAECCHGDLLMTVSNNFDLEIPPRKGKGIGLSNTINRLQLVYEKPDLLAIHKTDREYSVQMIIPQSGHE